MSKFEYVLVEKFHSKYWKVDEYERDGINYDDSKEVQAYKKKYVCLRQIKNGVS